MIKHLSNDELILLLARQESDEINIKTIEPQKHIEECLICELRLEQMKNNPFYSGLVAMKKDIDMIGKKEETISLCQFHLEFVTAKQVFEKEIFAMAAGVPTEIPEFEVALPPEIDDKISISGRVIQEYPYDYLIEFNGMKDEVKSGLQIDVFYKGQEKADRFLGKEICHGGWRIPGKLAKKISKILIKPCD